MEDTSPLDEDWPFPVDWLDSMGANRDDFAAVEKVSVTAEAGRSLQQGRVGGKGMRPLAHLQEAVKSVAVAARTGT